MTDGARAMAVAFVAIAIVMVRLSRTALKADTNSAASLVAELRLAQFAALVLTLTAGIYIGSALVQESSTGSGLDVALAVGFLVIGSIAVTQDPSNALTLLAAAFIAHAGIDLLHGSQILPGNVLPTWHATASAIYDVAVAAVCYLPVLRRP
ncbi:MAG: hypothetical protein CL484_09580 [Acidobacteria bacterium]|nr:hypothetical protein [Acidobacteriota bacterium]